MLFRSPRYKLGRLTLRDDQIVEVATFRLLRLLSERVHQIHQVPADFFFCPVAFTTHHFPASIRDDVKKRTIRVLRDRLGIAPVIQLQLHGFRQIALAITIFSVAHRAMILEKFPGFRQSFRSGFHWILLGRIRFRDWGRSLLRLRTFFLLS